MSSSPVGLNLSVATITWESSGRLAVTAECRAPSPPHLIPPNPHCLRFTDEETEAWRVNELAKVPRPDLVTPPGRLPYPLPATRAATCRLVSGSRWEASQWGQGINSSCGQSSCSSPCAPGHAAFMFLVDKVLHLDALSGCRAISSLTPGKTIWPTLTDVAITQSLSPSSCPIPTLGGAGSPGLQSPGEGPQIHFLATPPLCPEADSVGPAAAAGGSFSESRISGLPMTLLS